MCSAQVEGEHVLRAWGEGRRVGGELTFGGRRRVRELLPDGLGFLSEEERVTLVESEGAGCTVGDKKTAERFGSNTQEGWERSLSRGREVPRSKEDAAVELGDSELW